MGKKYTTDSINIGDHNLDASMMASLNTVVSNHGSYATSGDIFSGNYNDLTNKPTIPSLNGYATQSYVTTQINNLVASAPGSLNTLNELAAALGDDANFSATVTNSIAAKLPLAGGTMTGNLTVPQIITTHNGSGTNIRIGDDAWFGDTNVANTVQVTGSQDSTKGYIVFGSSDNTALGRSGTGNLTYGTNNVFHDGYHPNADKWTSARTITLTGDASGSVSWDGSANVSLSVAVNNDSHSHSWNNITSKPTTFAPSTHTHSKLHENGTIDFGASYVQWTDQSGNGGTGLDGSTPRNPANGWYHNLIFNHANSSGYYSQIATGLNSSDIYFSRVQGGNVQAWQRIFADDYHPNADKWTTARTLSLTGDVTGSVSWDGSGNASITATVQDDSHNHTISNIDSLQSALDNKASASHNHDDRYYTESESNSRFVNVTGDTMSGSLDVNADIQANTFTQAASGIPRNNLGSPTVSEMALFDNQFTPKTTLANDYDDLSDLTFWKQDTSSSAWTEVTSVSDDQKRRFLRTNNSNIAIPNGAYKYRVEFVGKSYTYANAMYAYWSSNSHSTRVHIWKYNQLNSAWVQHTSSSTTVSSWPGHLYLPFSTIPWDENRTTSASHYKSVRIEFTPTWSTGSYSDRVINLYGMQIWGGYPSGRREQHYYDQNGELNVTKDLDVQGDIKAPIFYDSNDTAYYVNPASTTRVNDLDVINKRTDFAQSTNWDAVDFSNLTNLHMNGHNQFWIGAGNGTWFTGSANTKSQISGLAADAPKAHDLLITTMSGDSTYDRGITFAVDSGGTGTSGWRLGKWHSGDSRAASLLAIDGQLVAKGGNTDEYDYYGDDYSTRYNDGEANWGGDTNAGWHKPSIVASSAIQIQSRNGGSATTKKPQIQFHQYGYGGPAIEYDGPNKKLQIGMIGSSTANRFNTFSLKFGSNEAFIVNTDYALHNSDMRAPIFYDSSNTVFYVNPASTSNINGLKVNGNFDVADRVEIDTYNSAGTGNNSFTSGYLRIIAGGKTGWGVDDELGKIEFYGEDGSGVGARTAASIIAVCESGNGTSTTTFSSGLAFYTSPSNAAQEERIRITDDGNVGIGTTSPGAKLEVTNNSGGTGIKINPSGGYGQVLIDMLGAGYGTGIQFKRNSSFGSMAFRILNESSSTVGSIIANSSSTSYNTSSDYRLKENIVPITNGIDRIKSLKPCRFNFIEGEDNAPVDGFIAHETADVVPESVTGEKDAVDIHGNPEYQGIDQSKIVPLLTAALQEAIQKIEQLENRIQILENN